MDELDLVIANLFHKKKEKKYNTDTRRAIEEIHDKRKREEEFNYLSGGNDEMVQTHER